MYDAFNICFVLKVIKKIEYNSKIYARNDKTKAG